MWHEVEPLHRWGMITPIQEGRWGIRQVTRGVGRDGL
jgi:hypothetical protein